MLQYVGNPPGYVPPTEREIAKAARAIAVENIKVTTQAGHTFDGDETSQARMARAVLVLSTGAAASVPWVLADNTVIQASAAELTEALALAGAEQARLWVLADNTVIQATADELTEAPALAGDELTEAPALAGAEQASLWVLPSGII